MNQVLISGIVQALKPLRYTPAGLPIQEIILEHNEQVIEAGKPRQIQMQLSVKVLGDMALKASELSTGTALMCEGFLAPVRYGSQSLQLRLTTWRLL